MPTPPDREVVLTVEEQRELVDYLENQYLSPSKHPALCRLMDRLMPKVQVGRDA